jgi:hypothetical protein
MFARGDFYDTGQDLLQNVSVCGGNCDNEDEGRFGTFTKNLELLYTSGGLIG